MTAQVEGSVTNSRMQEITGEHSKDITGVLQTLVRAALLRHVQGRAQAGSLLDTRGDSGCLFPVPGW